MASKVTLAIAMALVCCVAYAQLVMMLGGLQPEMPADAHVEELLESVKHEVEREAHTEFKSLEAIKFRQQLVNGMNYFIKALATNSRGEKSYVHVRIYQPTRGPIEMLAVQKDQSETTKLDYFQ